MHPGHFKWQNLMTPKGDEKHKGDTIRGPKTTTFQVGLMYFLLSRITEMIKIILSK